MKDFAFWIVKALLGDEPVERLMYIFIATFLLLQFAPDSFSSSMNAKVGYAYAYQTFAFCVAYAVALNVQRIAEVVRNTWRERKDKIEKEKENLACQHQILEMSAVMDSLNQNQKNILCERMVPPDRSFTYQTGDPDVLDMFNRGIAIPTPGGITRTMMLGKPDSLPSGIWTFASISDAYWHVMHLKWNAATSNFDKVIRF
ncbi:hypothetical protein PFH69_000389 [Klebsiella oxytoca]|nr:superinfection exclusion B family protein [Klebsiella oxytoca]